MHISGTKVRSVNPGRVSPSRDGWKYSILVESNHGINTIFSKEQYSTAAIAKQSMREEVARLKRVHGLG